MVGSRGLVLSLNFYKQLVSRFSSRQSLGFGTLEGVFSKIPSRGDLRLDYASEGEPVTLPVTLIHLLENEGKLGAIDCFFQLVHTNCLVSSYVVPTKG